MANPTAGPDTFIVGAPKCGTTALFDYLRQHPDVFGCPEKEPYHFCDDSEVAPRWRVADRQAYLALFKDARPNQRRLEASPHYLCSRTAPEAIRRFAPEARIIIMLRDPVKMLESIHRQSLWSANHRIKDFLTVYEANGDRSTEPRLPKSPRYPIALRYRDIASFAKPVERYVSLFRPEHVMVILYQDFAQDTAGTYQRVLEFLNLPPHTPPSFKPVNVGKPVGLATLIQIVALCPPLLSLCRKIITRERENYIVDRIPRWLRLKSSAARLPPEAIERVRRDLAPDIKALARVIDRDLGDWLPKEH